MKGRVLSIAGSDSGGGAGIQADIKTVTALGGYALTALTALTAQDTQAVHAVHMVPGPFIRLQIMHALADPGADAIKTGMLGDRDAMEVVCDALAGCLLPLVVDPVMVAKGGQSLLAADAVATLRHRLIPRATLLTPNIPEAEALTGRVIGSLADMVAAADALLALGAGAVLLKGGHLSGHTMHDVLASGAERHVFTHAKQQTRHTHGTGCTLASAVATGLAQGMALQPAVGRAIAYLQAAIAAAPGYGLGHGPVNHCVEAGQEFAAPSERRP
jgi:hydroxymethylpyrimidine/phosphomethylpyrimidine kinase